jgi:hypothetical protein
MLERAAGPALFRRAKEANQFWCWRLTDATPLTIGQGVNVTEQRLTSPNEIAAVAAHDVACLGSAKMSAILVAIGGTTDNVLQCGIGRH